MGFDCLYCPSFCLGEARRGDLYTRVKTKYSTRGELRLKGGKTGAKANAEKGAKVKGSKTKGIQRSVRMGA